MDPYAVLGLKHGASEQEAKEAFRKLAKTCHPDLHPNDADAERRFKEINAAYDAIRNPQPEPQPHIQWHTFHSGGGHSPFEPGSPFEDIFSQVFGRPRNPDAYLDCRMTLEETFLGREMTLSVPAGSKSPRTIKVAIPPGVVHGMRIRVQGGGQQSHPGMGPGDLFLVINVPHHERFTRQGNNLHVAVPVTVFDVLLCHDLTVMGIDGHALRVAIPAGYDSRKLRLTGQGMPDPHSGVRGDLFVELFIQYPVLSDAQRMLVEQASTQ